MKLVKFRAGGELEICRRFRWMPFIRDNALVWFDYIYVARVSGKVEDITDALFFRWRRLDVVSKNTYDLLDMIEKRFGVVRCKATFARSAYGWNVGDCNSVRLRVSDTTVNADTIEEGIEKLWNALYEKCYEGVDVKHQRHEELGGLHG